VFVELGLKLLHRQGQLAYILPHKFFNAQYGEPLRRLLADSKHLRHVVHFGDQQVFPGATNYVCLLFLTKAASDHCCFIRADDLPAWLGEGKSDEASGVPVPTHGDPTPLPIPGSSVPCIVPGTLSCYGKLLYIPWDRAVQRESVPGGRAMEVAIHLPDDVAAAVPWDDLPRHIIEQIALEGYQDGWLSEEQVRRLLGYETRLEVHGFLKDHDVQLRYTLEHLEQDREAHRQLGF
jgi:hypothetical protein